MHIYIYIEREREREIRFVYNICITPTIFFFKKKTNQMVNLKKIIIIQKL
jgi:hypothetical protein